MKTIVEIEKEYADFTPQYEVNCIDDVMVYLEMQLDTCKENQRVTEEEIRDNNKEKILAILRNTFLFFIYEQEEVDYYDKDNNLVKELAIMNKIYENYFEQMESAVNEINFREMEKLLEFIMLYYERNTNFIDSQRDALEYIYKGYSLINNREEDNFEVIDEFFSNKMYEISGKIVEKKKEMC